MDARDPLASNADLWAEYFRQQWRPWLDPWGLRATDTADTITGIMADVAAASAASMVAFFMAPRIDRMFRMNAPAVTQFVQETAHPAPSEIPAEFRIAVEPETSTSPRAGSERSPARARRPRRGNRRRAAGTAEPSTTPDRPAADTPLRVR